MPLNLKRNSFLKQVKKKKETVVSLVVFLIFLLAAAAILKDINPAKEDVPNYSELSKNPHAEYEKFLSGESVKELINSRQFFEMKYGGDAVEEKEPLMREDPFIEKFSAEYSDENGNNSANNGNEGEDEGGEE